MKLTHLLPLILLTGCVVGPEYFPPSPETPTDWKWSCSEPDCRPEFVGFWWELFQDPILDELEQQAVAYNYSLDAAFGNVLAERAMLGVAASQLYPQFNLTPIEAMQQMSLFKIFSVPGAGFPTTDIRVKQQNYELPLAVNYELDLWGKYFNKTRSAYAQYESTEEQYYGALLTVTTDLALNYFQLRATDTIISIYNKTLDSLKDQVEIVTQRNNAGLANEIDLKQAQTLYNSTKTQILDVKRQKAQYENAIAVLIGQPPSDFCIEVEVITSPPPCVPPGVPSRVLKRRPDIAAADRMLASATYEIGAAEADFYPDVSLTGDIGFLSPDFSKFLSWQSRFWSWLILISQPVFTGGRIEFQVENKQALLRVAGANYEQQVLVAFQEVEDSLSAIHFYKEQNESQNAATSDAGDVVDLANQRYIQGLVNYLEVITAEQTYLDNQRTQANILAAEYLSTIRLIKALGGGWDCP